MRLRRGGIDPPFWWKPWIGPLGALDDWWHRDRPPSRRDLRRYRKQREAGEWMQVSPPPGRTLTVIYRPLAGAWWEATSPQIGDLYKGTDLTELQEAVRARLAEWLDPEVAVLERTEG